MRSPVMGSPFWFLKAFPRAVMMFAGFCGAGDSDAFVAIAACRATFKWDKGSGTTCVGTNFHSGKPLYETIHRYGHLLGTATYCCSSR